MMDDRHHCRQASRVQVEVDARRKTRHDVMQTITSCSGSSANSIAGQKSYKNLINRDMVLTTALSFGRASNKAKIDVKTSRALEYVADAPPYVKPFRSIHVYPRRQKVSPSKPEVGCLVSVLPSLGTVSGPPASCSSSVEHDKTRSANRKHVRDDLDAPG